MIETLCLAPLALSAFLNVLDPEIVEPQDDKVIIHAEAGAVEWVYIEDLKMFAIDGERRYCVADTET